MQVNPQIIEGLMDASANIKMAGTPMSVYRQASAEGDTEKMKRALGYAGECTQRAAKYQEKLEEGIKAEREEAKKDKEAELDNRLEEQNKPEHKCTDTVEISEEARAAQANEPVEMATEPVVYTNSGEASPLPAAETAVIFNA